ncbi:hypothetical protein X777_08724 [Ooceraea biroi]|uniref:Uncharacterized protein n=1 Tax=Ooceraea biroi TaxID=2015173 RepID=A0A026W977_OOCBI|nr:hypothetical protein X777_08724 [Ooceraea biroi]
MKYYRHALSSPNINLPWFYSLLCQCHSYYLMFGMMVTFAQFAYQVYFTPNSID